MSIIGALLGVLIDPPWIGVVIFLIGWLLGSVGFFIHAGVVLEKIRKKFVRSDEARPELPDTSSHERSPPPGAT